MIKSHVLRTLYKVYYKLHEFIRHLCMYPMTGIKFLDDMTREEVLYERLVVPIDELALSPFHK